MSFLGADYCVGFLNEPIDTFVQLEDQIIVFLIDAGRQQFHSVLHQALDLVSDDRRIVRAAACLVMAFLGICIPRRAASGNT